MNDFAEFGRLLRDLRERKGLTREDVVKKTRLAPSVVAALEDGQLKKLPDQVFIQNHVRAFAAAIGAPENELMDKLLALPGFLAPTEMSPVRREAQRRKSAWKELTVLVVVAGIAGAVLWWWMNRP